jgi:hypothetical protein
MTTPTKKAKKRQSRRWRLLTPPTPTRALDPARPYDVLPLLQLLIGVCTLGPLTGDVSNIAALMAGVSILMRVTLITGCLLLRRIKRMTLETSLPSCAGLLLLP